MFEECNDHLDIWINGFINLDHKKKVIKWFIHIIKEAVNDIEKYVNEIIKTEEIFDQEAVHIDRFQNIFDGKI